MELTTYFSQVLGIYLIIMGLAVLLRKRYFIMVIGAFPEERLVRMIVSSCELLAGLFLVMAHNDWSSLPASLITLFGWAMIAEGALYLFMKDADVEKIFKKLNKRAWYVWGGLISIALGIYLAGVGFGWF